MTAAVERARDLVALDLALDALEQIDVRKSRVVELRYFCGLSVEETAAALAVSQRRYRDWRLARAWLRRELRQGSTDGSDRWSRIEQLYHEAANSIGRSGRFLARRAPTIQPC